MLPHGVRSRVAFAVANAAAGSTGDALAASGGRPLPHRAQHQQEPPLGLAAHLGGPPENDHLFPLRRCACAHRRQGVAAAAAATASRRRSRTALVGVLRTQLQHVKCGSGAARLVGRSRYCRKCGGDWWLPALLRDWHVLELLGSGVSADSQDRPTASDRLSTAESRQRWGACRNSRSASLRHQLTLGASMRRRLRGGPIASPLHAAQEHAFLLNLVARWSGGQCQEQLSLDSPQALCCIAQPVGGASRCPVLQSIPARAA